MQEIIPILAFGLVVAASHFLEGITGFGCTVLAMPFAVMLLGMPVAKPVLTIYGFALALYITLKSLRQIDWKQYRRMLLFLLPGLPIGMAVYQFLPQNQLLIALGVFIGLVSLRGLLISGRSKKPIPDGAAMVLSFLSGITHGAFSSGGPLITAYATEKIKDKSAFRATLCLIWVTLNSILIVQMGASGAFSSEKFLKTLIIGCPFLIAGSLLGDYAHKNIRDTIFTQIIYATLLLTGVFMLIQTIF